MSDTVDEPDLCAASELRAEPHTWLWPGRLALGKVAIFDGDPDLGKSLVALDLCARLSTGRPLPDGAPPAGPAAAIYLNAEDTAPDTILPRLQALDADLARVFLLHRNHGRLDQPLTIPRHCDFLDRMLARTGARLLVLDPIVAFLDPGVLAGNDQSVRRALYPLAVLAEKHQAVILLIRHLNKKGGDAALYRGAFSIGLIACCRSGWLFAPEPSPPGPELDEPANHSSRRCVMAQLKNNLGPIQPSLAYEVLAAEGPGPRLNWLGPCTWTARQLLARTHEKPLRPRQQACQFLKAFLAEGPRTTADIFQAGAANDLSERTLYRARDTIPLNSQEATVNGKRLTYWLLPGQALPPQSGLSLPFDVDPEIAEILERYERASRGNDPEDVVAADGGAAARPPALTPAAPLGGDVPARSDASPAATDPAASSAAKKPAKPLPAWMVAMGW